MAREPFDWTDTALKAVVQLKPSPDEVDFINRCMEEGIRGIREVSRVPIMIEGKELFYISAGRFGIIFFKASETPCIANVILRAGTG
jgi:hypothetical protein